MSRLRAFAVVAALVAFTACDGTAVVGGIAPPDATFLDTPDAADAGLVCPSPLAACGGRCTDPRTDRENCGACGRFCGAANVCQNGACVPDCTAGETLCMTAATGDAGASLRCVSLQTSRENCGACGTACGRDQVCTGGVCTFMCTGTTTECMGAADMDAGTSGRYCAELQTDRLNCGACGNTCQEGYTCQDG
ncbi:MAG: hypothetical protein U0326_43820, partial [Polyangiales bacterium]